MFESGDEREDPGRGSSAFEPAAASAAETAPRPDAAPADAADEPEGRGLPAYFRSQETREAVEQAKAGDVDALNELFARHYGHMVALARRRLGARLRGKEEADDLAQTTFREATRDFQQYEYRGEGSLLRWLVQILHNKIRDRAEYYAAGKRDVSRERTLDERPGDAASEPLRFEAPADDLSVTRQVQRKEEFSILREALGKLSPDHRTAITLVFFQGLTLRQAGERMGGRTEDAVRMMLRRAEEKLRELTRTRLSR
jgi:RNA polymerase sigma-70 factor (ECF subfamily)